MSSQPSRPIYLRDQAEKCRWQASMVSDATTKAELPKLAREYVERAAQIERAK
jgi:hypothetical protein